MPRRDRLDDAAPYDLVGQLTVTPLTDRATGVGRHFARQGDDLADLLRRELRRRASLWQIRQPLGHVELLQRYFGKLQPTPSPVSRRLVIDTQLASYLQIVPSVARQQHNARAQRQLLGRAIRAHQTLQFGTFPLTQYHFGRFRRGHRLFRSNQDA